MFISFAHNASGDNTTLFVLSARPKTMNMIVANRRVIQWSHHIVSSQ